MHMGVGFGISQGVNALPAFLQRYPEVELDLVLEDRRVDLVQENIDVSTWSFPPYSANVIAKKLFDCERVLCASPEYLERHGTPATPDDLARHRCMIVSGVPLQSRWFFETTSGKRHFDVPPAIAVNNVDSKYRFALAGVGIAQFSEYIVADAPKMVKFALGENVTRWMKSNSDLEIVDKVVTQSSDHEFHCLTVTIFYRERPAPAG